MLDHPDYLERDPVLAPQRLYPDGSADRILLWEDSGGEQIIHDRNVGVVDEVSFSKGPAVDSGGLHRLEVARRR